MQLTTKLIGGLERRAKRYYVGDDDYPGLCVCVAPSGSKTFYYRHKVGRTRALVNLGVYPTVGLKDARDLWAKQRATPAVERVDHYLRDDIKLFEVDMSKRRLSVGTQREYSKQLAKLQSALGADAMTSAVDEVAVEDLFDALSMKSHDQGNRMLKVITQFYKFLKRHYKRTNTHVSGNPCDGIKRNPKGIDLHHLTQTDLERFVKCIPKHRIGEQKKLALIFQLITGCRVVEALSIHKAQFTEDGERLMWTLNPDENKMHRQHVLPLPIRLSKLIRSTIATHPGPRLCEHNGAIPSWDTYRHSIRFVCHTAKVRMISGKHLRTTVNTLLAKLSCDARIRVAILNHAPQGVNELVYNAYEYYDEKAFWLQKLEDLYASYGLFDTKYHKKRPPLQPSVHAASELPAPI